MKKICSLLIILTLVFSSAVFAEEITTDPTAEAVTAAEAPVVTEDAAAAEDEIKVIVKEQSVEFDVPPQLIDGRTMVPMRKIFETLGAKVQWFEESQLIFATYSSCIMAMEIGKDSFIVTDILADTEKTIELDVAPVVIDGRTLVPVRAISESMGLTVEWIEETQTVVIY